MRYELASSTWGDEEKQAVQRVLEAGFYTMSRNVREFEERFASHWGMKYAVMCNSGSSANLVALASLFYKKEKPLQKGDEVIVPCISWATTFHPLYQYGLKIKFVDVDIQTLNCDVNELKKAITDKTKLIVAVNVLGNPCLLDEIASLCEEKGIILFEDNCESMGARFKGRYTGTFGLVNTFSTFFSHHISTMEGGLVLTNDKEIYHILLALRNHGWIRDLEEESPLFQKTDDDFYEAYRFILPGYNVRPLEIQGAIGIQQLAKLDKFINMRRENARHFVELFGNDERFIIQKENGESSWFAFTMILSPQWDIERKRVLALLRERGIEHRMVTGGNILRHDVIGYYNFSVSSRKNSDFIHDRGFFVGNHPYDIRDRIDYLYKVLKECADW